MYPHEEKRKGIIFSLAQGPVCACVRLWACVYVGDWAFEGDSRLLGVIMRTNAELTVIKMLTIWCQNVTSNTVRIYIAFHIFTFSTDYLMSLLL